MNTFRQLEMIKIKGRLFMSDIQNSLNHIVDDYSLRELQIYSSKILSTHESTSNFIKQFNSDHDSVQFYKNVIIWYIKNYKELPDEKFN